MKSKKKELRRSNEIFGAKLTEQQLEMDRTLELSAKDKETISNLNADRKKYLAKLSQLRRGLKEDTIILLKLKVTQEMRVQCISSMRFCQLGLPAWEGYDSSHNMCEPESNILCQSTLDRYKKKPIT